MKIVLISGSHQDASLVAQEIPRDSWDARNTQAIAKV